MMKYIFSIVFLAVWLFSSSQEEMDAAAFQKHLNQEYADSLTSPLKRKDRLLFKAHEFYPIDPKYKIVAEFKRTPDEQPFKMATTKGVTRDYIKYGEIEFSIDGKKLKLNIYQSLDLMKVAAYQNYLFLPFKDLTNVTETYGGGRFIDLQIPSGTTIICDFNKAYNPYCAYTDAYSCPITPVENTLDIAIKAGIRLNSTH